MRITASIILLFTIVSCTDRQNDDWTQEYIDQEKTRTTTITRYFDFDSGSYSLESIDTTFETFNAKGQKIRTRFGRFCDYDDMGTLQVEKYPVIKKNSSGGPGEHDIDSTEYYYDTNGLLTKILFGGEYFTDEFSYDSLSRQKSKVRKVYHEKTDSWDKFVDTMFYEQGKYHINYMHTYLREGVLTKSTYTYTSGDMIKSKIDTTITSAPLYQIHPGFNSRYMRTDYKYNGENKLIEEVWSETDYKTPYLKITYEYVETRTK